jgi:hypothetical protein
VRLRNAVADNVAPTLTVTVALAAAGLAVTTRTTGWPFWIGVALVTVGGVGALLTLGVALARSVKTRAFRDALGRALAAGEKVLAANPDETKARAWGQSVYNLILSGLGESEAQLFLSNHDLGVAYASQKDTSGTLFMRRRLQRLARLLDRAYAQHVGVDFSPKHARELFPVDG